MNKISRSVNLGAGIVPDRGASAEVVYVFGEMPKQQPIKPSPDGWQRQGVMVPDDVWAATRGIAGRRGHGSMKTITTLALGMAAGMPEQVRNRVMAWISSTEWEKGPKAITPEAIFAEYQAATRDLAKSASNISVIDPVKPMPVVPVNGPNGGDITHEVTRILDPEILKGKKKGAA